jgi:hypothetical protein
MANMLPSTDSESMRNALMSLVVAFAVNPSMKATHVSNSFFIHMLFLVVLF